jgi:hypothetical protein
MAAHKKLATSILTCEAAWVVAWVVTWVVAWIRPWDLAWVLQMVGTLQGKQVNVEHLDTRALRTVQTSCRH